MDATRSEIIVVDDGSIDDSWEAVKNRSALLIRQRHKGAAAARNRGFRAASGKYILFLDADCRAGDEWIKKISRPLIEGEAQVTVGRFESSQSCLLSRLTQLELERRSQRMKSFQRVDFINSGTCGFTREALSHNLFDESFSKLEDVELAFRMATQGVRILFVPGAVADHHHPEKLGNYLIRKWRYGLSAPRLYRRFPSKTIGDSSTPPTRRLEIILIASGFLVLWFSRLIGILLLAAALAISLVTAVRATRTAGPLGLLLPFLSLAGSSVFLAGACLGLILLALRKEPG